jgi:hypothetical protein
MFTYEQILDISLKINRKELFLDETVYQKLNAIKKQLNIQVNELLKKTIIKKQENAYGQVFKLLNKITEKNYDKLKGELFDLIKQIESEDEINKLRSKLLPKLEDMLKKHDWTYKMSDDSSNFSKGSRQEDEINKLVDLLGKKGKELFDKYSPSMGMEEGLKRTIRESQKKKALREKLREMILAEMDEAKKAEDDEDEVEIEDIDVSDDEMRGGDNPEIDKIQDLLEQLQNAAEDLGDEKLLTQIGNIITFFTRQHVANADADNMG